MFDFAKLDARRKELGIKQAFIAQSIKRTPTVYQDWKLGKSIPSEEQLTVISRLLNTTVEYLIGESEQKEKPALVSESGQNKNELELIQAYREAPENVKEAIQILLRQK